MQANNEKLIINELGHYIYTASQSIYPPCTTELLEMPDPDPEDSTAEALVTTFSVQ